ncbi:MAG: hypothetical protein DRN68_05090 [Thaumarchaeota archaeon]|nr:MAG: hypothetical protein DRN68_05090 [Nitrososphaerota archaeon]
MGRVYLLSSMIVPISFEYESIIVVVKQISVEEARRILERGFISAVGHEPTARFLSRILDLEVKPNRETIYLHEGDVAIAIQFGERIQRVELREEEVERYFKEGKARFLKITVDRPIIQGDKEYESGC